MVACQKCEGTGVTLNKRPYMDPAESCAACNGTGKTKRPHWHANCHIPGYLPEDNPIFATKAAAQDHMRWLRDDWRDMQADQKDYNFQDTIRIQGSIRSGLIVVSWGEHGCGRYIECYPCTEDCEEEEF